MLYTAKICERTTEKPLLSLGIVQSIQDNVSASNLTTPILTYTAENTFTMDIKSTESFSLKFERTNNSNDGNVVPVDPEDPSKGTRPMNNAEWITAARRLINQWQAKHDGYYLVCDEKIRDPYDPDPEEEPYVLNYPPIHQKGYIKSLHISYKCGDPEHITGTISFQSGSMKGKNGLTARSNGEKNVITGYGPKINLKDGYITMTSSDHGISYSLYYFSKDDDKEALTCVLSYELNYGFTEPFPYLTMSISRRRLMCIAPDLVEDIIAGKNKITIGMCGKSEFIVTKCKSDGQKYSITAYALEEIYKGAGIREEYTQASGPMTIIRRILLEKITVSGSVLSFNDADILFIGTSFEDSWGGSEIKFDMTCTCWYVLSVCALYLDSSIFFIGGKAYIVQKSADPNQTKLKFPEEIFKYFDKTIYLNSIDGIPSDPDILDFCKSVQDQPSLGDEGIDTLCNSVTVTYGSRGDMAVTNRNYSSEIAASQDTFGVRSNNILIENISSEAAQAIADTYVHPFLDTQQSITFTLSETYDDGSNEKNLYWQSYFPDITYVDAFVDFNTDSFISNVTSFVFNDRYSKKLYPKLMLSTIKRKFPDFSSEYTFGRISNADLSQTTSIILGVLRK